MIIYPDVRWRMYGKTWAAIAYAVAVAVQTTLSDRHVTHVEWVQIAIACLTAFGVYAAPITSRYKWVKTDVALALAVLQSFVTVMLTGSEDWFTLTIAGVGALVIWLMPATTFNPSGTGDVSVPLGTDR